MIRFIRRLLWASELRYALYFRVDGRVYGPVGLFLQGEAAHSFGALWYSDPVVKKV